MHPVMSSTFGFEPFPPSGRKIIAFFFQGMFVLFRIYSDRSELQFTTRCNPSRKNSNRRFSFLNRCLFFFVDKYNVRRAVSLVVVFFIYLNLN